MSSSSNIILGLEIYLGVSVIMVAVPIYSWLSLFFGIPMFFIEPLIAIYCYTTGGSYTFYYTDKTFYLWVSTISWVILPLCWFLSIFGEIILIPSFFLGLPALLASLGLFVFLLYAVALMI